MIVTDREVLKNNGAETILSDPELIDGFCDELATVLQNIDDPRTNPTKPRKIIIEFEISATSNKETIAISASTNSKIVKKEMDRRFIAKKEFNLNRFIIYKKKNMNELIAKIKELNEAFMSDAALQIEKGNKAAGTRARKASLELEKLMKEFRKASLEASK